MSYRAIPSALIPLAQAGVVFDAMSGPINFLDTGAPGTATFDMPLISGMSAITVTMRVVVLARSGAAATGSWVCGVGNDAGVTNVINGLSAAASSFNATAAGITPPFSFSGGTGFNIVSVASTVFTVKTTTALATATSMTGYVTLQFRYVPSP